MDPAPVFNVFVDEACRCTIGLHRLNRSGQGALGLDGSQSLVNMVVNMLVNMVAGSGEPGRRDAVVVEHMFPIGFRAAMVRGSSRVT